MTGDRDAPPLVGARPEPLQAREVAARPMLGQVLTLAALLGAVLLAALVLARETGMSLSFFTRDPGSLGRLPWYAGVLSQLTVLIWASAATSLLLAARLAPPARRPAALFLGLLALVVGADDALQLHEGAAGVIPGSDLTVVAVYGIAAPLALLLVWRAYATEVLLPLLGAGGLALSALADLAEVGGAAAEDAPKLVAAALWALCGTRLLSREAVGGHRS